MKTTSAYILYTPLTVALEMEMVGGSTSQIKDLVSGLYSPDRGMTPLVLRPKLQVVDTDGVIADGDYTSQLIDCRWYIGNDSNGTRINSGDDIYVLGEQGQLTVKKNVESDLPVSLYFSCAFIDPRTQNTFRKSFNVTLTSITASVANLALEIDAAKKMAISPFKNFVTRTITVYLRNGETPVDDDKATFNWYVYDTTTDKTRLIDEDDLFYVSGQGTKSLVIDARYIDKESITVEAFLNVMPDNIVSAKFLAYRWYGAWDEREVITSGKFIRADVSQISVQALIDTPKGNLSDITEYFDLTHIFTNNQVGAAETVIGYGESVTVPATIVGKDPNVIPIFGVEVKEKSAYRAVQVDGADAYINGQLMCLQIPK